MGTPYDLRLGDSREVLREIEDCSVDSCVTDPPYALESIVKRFGGKNAAPAKDRDGAFARQSRGFMGQAWDTGECAFDPAFWAEVWRVLKPGGHLLAFSGTRTYHRMTVAIEDAGFEIRDQIGWLYGSGFPKSHNQSGDWEGWGTALKPAWEPICVARKPLAGTVAANLSEFGTGAINVDACRIQTEEERKPVTGSGALPVRNNPDEPRSTGEISQPNVLGRWPANVVHDGSEEVLAEFTQFGSRGAAAPVRGTEASMAVESGAIYGLRNRVPGAFHADSGTAARFFYCAKATRSDRDEGAEGLQDAEGGVIRSENSGQHITRRDGWQPAPVKNNHPTVKPTALMQWLCRLVTPPGGLVLDPFMGSGSTGKAAMLEGFRFLGIEREPNFFDIAQARVSFGLRRSEEIAAEAARRNAQPDLFAAE